MRWRHHAGGKLERLDCPPNPLPNPKPEPAASTTPPAPATEPEEPLVVEPDPISMDDVLFERLPDGSYRVHTEDVDCVGYVGKDGKVWAVIEDGRPLTHNRFSTRKAATEALLVGLTT